MEVTVQDNRTVWVVTAEPEPTEPARRGLPVRTSPSGARSIEIDALRDNMRQFLAVLQEILPSEMTTVGDFRVDEVEVSAEVTGEGSLMLLGTGVRAAGAGGIKFILRRINGKQQSV